MILQSQYDLSFHSRKKNRVKKSHGKEKVHSSTFQLSPGMDTHFPGLFQQLLNGNLCKASSGKGSDDRTKLLLLAEHLLCARLLAGTVAFYPTSVLGGAGAPPPSDR